MENFSMCRNRFVGNRTRGCGKLCGPRSGLQLRSVAAAVWAENDVSVLGRAGLARRPKVGPFVHETAVRKFAFSLSRKDPGLATIITNKSETPAEWRRYPDSASEPLKCDVRSPIYRELVSTILPVWRRAFPRSGSAPWRWRAGLRR